MRYRLIITALVGSLLLALMIVFNTIGAQRDGNARQEAEAAIAELKRRSEVPDHWWRLRLRVNSTVRTYLIHNFGPLGVDPRIVVERLRIEGDPSARRALILSLGEYADQQLAPTLRQQFAPSLLRWYRNDPDAGSIRDRMVVPQF